MILLEWESIWPSGEGGLKTNCIGNGMYRTKRTSAVSAKDMRVPTWPSSGPPLSAHYQLTLNILKANKTEKLGIQYKRLFAGWDMDYREGVHAG